MMTRIIAALGRLLAALRPAPPLPTRLPADWEWKQGFLLTSLHDPDGHVRGCVFPILDREPPGWACWSAYPGGKAAPDPDRLPAPLDSGTVQAPNQPASIRSGKVAVEQALRRAGW